jgi:hypothetical protein
MAGRESVTLWASTALRVVSFDGMRQTIEVDPAASRGAV